MHSFSLIVAALACSSRGLASRSVFPAPSTNCTEYSSKSATWQIQKFKFDTDSKFSYGPGTAGTVSFTIRNTANDYTFDCLQGNGQTKREPNHFNKDGKLWYSCNVYCNGSQYTEEEDPPLATAFHFDLDTKTLSLNQEWTCGAENSTAQTIFTGVGSSIVPGVACRQIPDGRPDQVTCTPGDVIIKVSKVTSRPRNQIKDQDGESDDDDNFGPGGGGFNSGPRATVPKVKHDTTGCTKLSQSPSWQVSNFLYTGLGARFALTNNALNYTTRCNLADFSPLVADTTPAKTWWNCSSYDSRRASYPYDGVYTEIMFGGPQNILGINQTWYCDDEDSTSPTVFSAYADAKFLIYCNQTRSCTPGGEFSDRPLITSQQFCRVPDLNLTATRNNIYRTTRDQAINIFKPHGYNCSAPSLGSRGEPIWEISEFSFNRTWNQDWNAFKDEVQFVWNNTATDSDWPMNQNTKYCYEASSLTGPLFDGTRQLACSGGFGSDPPGFTLNFNTSMMTLDQGWRCDGIDREHLNYFDATGSAKLPLNCVPNGNGTICTAPKFSVGMANITSSLNVDSRGPV